MFIKVASATLRAHPKQALSTARQQGRGVYLCTQQHQRRPAEADQEIFAACLSRWHLRPRTAKSALYRRSNFFFSWVPSPPKNVGSSGQQMS